eukprot:Platyproteum_vivax@DN14630_c0_g1_i1.p1
MAFLDFSGACFDINNVLLCILIFFVNVYVYFVSFHDYVTVTVSNATETAGPDEDEIAGTIIELQHWPEIEELKTFDPPTSEKTNEKTETTTTVNGSKTVTEEPLPVKPSDVESSPTTTKPKKTVCKMPPVSPPVRPIEKLPWRQAATVSFEDCETPETDKKTVDGRLQPIKPSLRNTKTADFPQPSLSKSETSASVRFAGMSNSTSNKVHFSPKITHDSGSE